MLYLEDFLELIENLPSELRDRFTEIRTLDLEVQNGLDRADQNVEEFFKNAPSMNSEDQQRCFDKIKDDYRKILENADEKVNLATMMHDLVKRYLARLDQEVNKFKIELEADSPGITEMLEKNVKEAEQTSRVYKKQRYHKRKRTSAPTAAAVLVNGNGAVGHTEWAAHHHNASMDTSSAVGNVVTGVGFENSKSLVHPNVHAAIASASHFKKSQSYPNRMGEMRTLTINGQQMAVREKGSSSSTHSQATSGSFLHSFSEHTESRHGRPRKLTSRVSEMLRDVIQKQEQRERLGSDASSSSMAGAALAAAQNYYQQQQIQSGHHYHHGYQGGAGHISSSSSVLTKSGVATAASTDSDPDLAGNDSAELSDQSDQQRWCICNRVSFGAMVACDDKDCPFEWFHYECVGITQPPKGKWFCPHCTKRRK